MINIGKYIEMAINWLTENFAGLFDVINHIVGGFIDGFQGILMWVPFYLMIAGIAALAWWKAGKGTAVLTLLGLLLIWGMGFWVQTMQTVALVLSSTIIALLLGVPLGIWTGRNDKAAKVTAGFGPDADDARFCLFDSGCPVFRTGTCSGRFCHRDICHASGCPSYRLGDPSGSGRYCRGDSFVWGHFGTASF